MGAFISTLSLQRSREELKRQGCQTWIVEKPFNPYTKRREDLFNLFDLVGIRGDLVGVTGVQACGEDVASHIRKVTQGYTDGKGLTIPPNPYLRVWLQAGNRAFIWAWRKRGATGKRKLWELREVEFVLSPEGQIVAQENEVKAGEGATGRMASDSAMGGRSNGVG